MGREQRRFVELLNFEDMFYMGKFITVRLTRIESEDVDTGTWYTRFFVERDTECMSTMSIEATHVEAEAREAFEIFVNDMRVREELYQLNKPKLR